MTLTKHLTSSICWVVHNVHGSAADPSGFSLSSGVMIAALSKNLQMPWLNQYGQLAGFDQT